MLLFPNKNPTKQGHSKKYKNSRNSHKNQKHPAINPATLIIMVVESVIFPNKLLTFAIMKIE